MDNDADTETKEVERRFSALVREVTDVIKSGLMTQIGDVTAVKAVAENIKEAEPYLVAAGFLELAGKAADREYIERLVRVAGVEQPNRHMLDAVNILKHRNLLLYISAVAFCVGTNMEVTRENLARVVSAIDIPPEMKAADAAIELFKKAWGPTVDSV